MHFDLESSVRAGIRGLQALALIVALATPGLALAEEPSSDAGGAKAAPAAEPTPAAPAKAMNDEATVSYTPTAGPWRDRLRAARRDVLNATAALDDVNAAYARVLYETPDDKNKIAALQTKRKTAMNQLNAKRAAIPPLVEQARADGVSERILDLYEQATLETNK